MIQNDTELQVTTERIAHFQKQVAHLRRVIQDATSFHSVANGWLTEIDTMQREVREYLGAHPSELKAAG